MGFKEVDFEGNSLKDKRLLFYWSPPVFKKYAFLIFEELLEETTKIVTKCFRILRPIRHEHLFIFEKS